MLERMPGMPGMLGMLKSLHLPFSLDFGFPPTSTGFLRCYRDAREDARDAGDAEDRWWGRWPPNAIGVAEREARKKRKKEKEKRR